MAIAVFNGETIQSNSGWSGLTVIDLADHDLAHEAAGLPGNVFVMTLPDAPVGADNILTLTTRVRWNLSESATRDKNLLIEVVSSTGGSVSIFRTPVKNSAPASTYDEFIKTTTLSADSWNGATLRVTVEEGTGKADTAQALVDYLEVETEYSNLTATPGDGIVDLAWSEIQDTTEYRIYQSTTSPVSTTGTPDAVLPVGSTSYQAIGENGVTQYFKVGYVRSGSVYYSGEVSATPLAVPAAPTLTATGQDGAVELSWSTTGVISGYYIYRDTVAGGAKTLLHTIETLDTSRGWIDSTVTNGTTYFYEVSGYNASGEGPRSNEASATPEATTTDITGTAAVSSGGTTQTTGAKEAGITETVSVVAEVGATGTRVTEGTTSFISSSSVGSVGVKEGRVGVVVGAQSLVESSGGVTSISEGSASLSSTGGVEASGVKETRETTLFSSGLAVATGGEKAVSRTSKVTVVGEISSSGVKPIEEGVDVSAGVSLQTVGKVEKRGGGDLDSALLLVTAREKVVEGAPSLTGAMTLSFVGGVSKPIETLSFKLRITRRTDAQFRVSPHVNHSLVVSGGSMTPVNLRLTTNRDTTASITRVKKITRGRA